MVRRAGLVALLLVLAASTTAAREDGEDPARRALDWLVRHVADKGGSGGGNVNANADGKRFCALAATGFLLRQYPDAGDAALRERIDGEIVAILGGRGMIAVQDTWLHGFAALCLAEARLRGERNQAAIRRLVERVEDGQNAEGGWGHGAGLSLDFYPSTLVAATNWSLLALGIGRRAGVEVDEDVVARGVALLRRLQAPSGAFPYGGLAYRKGYELGRTTGSVAALAALEETDGALFRKAAAAVLAAPDTVPHGHASPAMHVLTGALAFRLLGEEAWARYDRTVLAKVRSRQRKDGAFDDVLPSSPDTMELLGGVKVNTAYVTALYAAALAMPRSKLAALLRSPAPGAAASDGPAPAGAGRSLWTADAGRPHAIVADRERVVALDADGTVTVRSAKDGRTKHRFHAKRLAGDRVALAGTALVDGALVVRLLESAAPRSEGVIPLSRSRIVERIVLLDLANGRERWTAEVPGPTLRLARTGDRLLVLGRGGHLRALSLETGEEKARLEAPSVLVNGGLAASPGGRLAVSGEARLLVLDGRGEVVWERSRGRRRGISPPAYAALVWQGDDLVVGRTDGRVTGRAGATGERRWRVDLAAAVSAIVAKGGDVHVATADGRITTLRDGAIAWSHTWPGVPRSIEPPRMVRDGDRVWVRAGERLVALDAATGKLLAVHEVPDHSPWAVAGARVFLATAAGILAMAAD